MKPIHSQLAFILIFIFSFLHSGAQNLTLEWQNTIAVFDENGNELKNPWAGGLNAVQYNTIDLNLDGVLDLVLFDRTSFQLQPYLAADEQYVFAPEYIPSFPKIEAWLVLADYNCDGKKDIFTHNNFGVTVFLNSSDTDRLQFTPIGIPETKGFSGSQIPLKVDITDVPAITDVDNDGDLDLLTFLTPNVGGTVEYNKNLSMELYGSCDSLVFEKETARWGGFEEAVICETYQFDSQARIEHAGSSILAIDMDADLDKDLIIGEIGCNNLVQMTNEGSLDDAAFTSANFTFPSSNPVNLQLFPTAFYEDINFDGKRDLLVSVNIDFNEGFLSDFKNSSWLYVNQGEDNAPIFAYTQSDFMQKDMLDFGESALPSLADTDNDGDPDLYVGSTGELKADGSFYSQIRYFENIGSADSPQFVLRDTDFLGLSELERIEIRPQWIDFNNDGALDFCFSSRTNGTQPELSCILNQNSSFNINERFNLPIEGIRVLDKPTLFDFDKDGDLDVLLAKLGGALEFHENDGSNSFSVTNDALGGIRYNFFDQRLCASIADINNDGEVDLVAGSRSGTLKTYLSIQEQPIENWENSPITFKNTNDPGTDVFFGRGFCPTAYKNHLVIGTIGGGLHYLKNETTIVSSLEDEKKVEDEISIFPNPAKSKINIAGFKGNSIELFTISGIQLEAMTTASYKGKNLIEFDVENYANGIYLLKFEYNDFTITKKVLVNH